jgi:sec-independent protein translocase protein TatA
MSVGPLQIVLILAILILLFGAGRLAAVGKGMGEGIRNFKRGLSDEASDDLSDDR